MFLKKYGEYKRTFLLIIEDEYVRKNNIINKSKALTRDVLTFRRLKSQINSECRDVSDIVKRSVPNTSSD